MSGSLTCTTSALATASACNATTTISIVRSDKQKRKIESDKIVYTTDSGYGTEIRIIKRNMGNWSRFFIGEFSEEIRIEHSHLDFDNIDIANNQLCKLIYKKLMNEVDNVKSKIKERIEYEQYKKEYINQHGRRGWYGERIRHSLARKKIKTRG